MAKLNILTLPDKRLKTIAKPVETFDAQLETLVANMLETMYAAPGIGLAATQVDVHEQLIVIDFLNFFSQYPSEIYAAISNRNFFIFPFL